MELCGIEREMRGGVGMVRSDTERILPYGDGRSMYGRWVEGWEATSWDRYVYALLLYESQAGGGWCPMVRDSELGMGGGVQVWLVKGPRASVFPVSEIP